MGEILRSRVGSQLAVKETKLYPLRRWNLLKFDSVELGYRGGIRLLVDFSEVYFLDTIGAERLHAGGARHRSGRN